MREIKELTGLRFIAALYVFLFHLQLRGILPDFGWRLNNIIGQGALGVNIFFVLSGLVLTYSHMGEHRGPTLFIPFILKRIIRVGPVYLAGLLAAIVVVVLMHEIPANLPWLVFLNLTFLNAWIPPVAMEWYSSGSWSISAEMFFYSLFPVLLPVALKLKQRTIVMLLLLVIVLAALPGLFAAFNSEMKLFNWVYPFPPARLPEFVCGVLLAVLIFRFDWQVPKWAPIISIGILFVYLSYFGPSLEGYVGHNWLLLPVLIVLIIGICRNPGLPLNLLSSPVLAYLGKVSYGFYIWQIVIMLVLEGKVLKGVLAPHSIKSSLLVLAVNLILAILSYHLLESRAHRWLSNKMAARKMRLAYSQPSA
ncbi:acyltransferase family protein [Hymenobacter lucidus]|uniref:Acyltransferase n=1 Tax=Hymenobacter lucidus TaxID=2880930 RepID=A0ABS8AQY2_9BACT|nr:acyltransferase [Hymenobacter lucidus]MCB2408509.1 acyltransferase [Hymenobacter lucidus]